MNPRYAFANALAAIPGAAALLLATLLIAGVSTLPASAQTEYHFYQLGTRDFSDVQANSFAGAMGFKPAARPPALDFVSPPAAPILSYTDANGVVRMVYYPDTHELDVFPDLTKSFGTAPTAEAAEDTARTYLEKNQLIPVNNVAAGPEFAVSDVVSLANESFTPAGANTAAVASAATDVIRGVHFKLMLDGLPVNGPSFNNSAEVSSNGVEGFHHTFRDYTELTKAPDMITETAANKLFTAQFGPVFNKIKDGDPNATYTVQSTTLVYYDSGRHFVQPAYEYKVLVSSPSGMQMGETWTVAASTNAPEDVSNMPYPSFGASAITPSEQVTTSSENLLKPNASAKTMPVSSATKPLGSKKGIYDPLDFGVYVVRDDSRFLNGANGFINNLIGGNFVADAFLGDSYPQTVLTQYYYDYPWIWENDPADGVPDNSPYFVGQCNLVLYEGHGAPWLGTTYSNCCDLINYTTIAGYGAYHDSEITNYVLWHTCDSVPAPGDPYGGDYASPATPFSVWFNVFKGMRGTYGSRTTVDIYDGVEPAFASAAALGVPNLSAWFNAEANDATGHGGGWDYACAVMISGHENDTIYNTGALSPPGSLDMWWQHP